MAQKMSKKKVSIIGIVLTFLMTFTLLGGTKVSYDSIKNGVLNLLAANENNTPIHEKILTDNKDGTFNLSLSVTGDSEKKVNKANVIVVMDVSGSMKSTATNYKYTASDNTDRNMYGLVDGQYVALTRHGSGGSRYYTYGDTFWSEGTRYTGQRYLRESFSETRLAAAKNAVNNLANALLANNSKEGYPSDTIEMALIKFSTTASTEISKTTSYSTFSTKVNSFNADGGTNWEDALQKVNSINFGDQDTTYVIFVSDGNPTFRNTKGNYNPMDNYYYSTEGVYGNGSDSQSVNGIPASTTISRCYDNAVDDAKAIVTSGKTFFTIGAYGDVDRMANLTTAAGAPAKNYYAASDTDELESALNDILNQIQTAGFGEVSITDGTTKSVTATSGSISGGMLDIDSSTFKYWLSFPITTSGETITSGVEYITSIESKGNNVYTLTAKNGNTFDVTRVEDKDKNGNVKENSFKFEWTDGNNPLHSENPPVATLNEAGDSVIWNLNSLDILLNDVTYTVTFDVWPSQVTLDLISDLKNGTVSYDSLPQKVKDNLVKNGNDYKLRTNTNATLSYDDTRTDANEPDIAYVNPDPVSTSASELLSIAKKWNNYLDDRNAQEIKLHITRDGVNHYEVTLNEDNEYKATEFISIGIMTVKNGNVSIKASGHDFAFAEDNNIAYYWDLKADEVHPMLINGKLTMLIKLDSAPSGMTGDIYNDGTNDYYKIGNSYYVAKDAATAKLDADNDRRSNLNVTKVVTGEDAPKDSLFTYSMKVTTGDKKDFWFSIQDEDGNTIKNTSDITYVSGATAEIKDNNETGYYYASSGTEVTIKLQAGWNLRFTNLPVDSTYEITETTMPDNFKFTSVAGEKEVFTAKNKSTKSEEGTVAGKKITGTIEANNSIYTITYTNDYTKTHIDLTKNWEDNSNQDGKRPTSVEVVVVGTITVDNKEQEVSRKNYTIEKPTVEAGKEEPNTWTKTIDNLDRYSDGHEITYKIESESNVANYNTKEGQPAINDLTVTNTHEIEKDKLTLTKNWEDKSNQDGKRPTSVKVVVVGKITIDNKEKQVFEKEYTINGDMTKNTWTKETEELDVYAEGQKITYTISSESSITDYNTKEGQPAIDGLSVTNTHETETTKITLTKNWNDDSNRDEKRPTSVKVKVVGNITIDNKEEKVFEEEYTIDGDMTKNTWTKEIKGLDKKAKGQDIVYTILSEDAVDNYNEPEIDGLSVTNTHTLETRDITVTKKWNDNEDQDGKRPTSINVSLYNGDTKVGTQELNEGNKWTAVFKNVPKFQTGAVGQEIKYIASEDTVPSEYTPSGGTMTVGEDGKASITVINTHETDKISITVEKKWEDANNQDGVRPESVQVQLYAGDNAYGDPVTLNEDNEWKTTYTNLEKNESGSAINYTVKELGTKEENGKEILLGTDGTSKYEVKVSGSIEEGFTITNTHTPDEVSISVKKVWTDNDNQDGIRPQEITVELLANGESLNPRTTVLLSNNKLTHTFTKLPKKANGQVINYTVKELDTKTVDGEEVMYGTDKTGIYKVSTTGSMEDGYVITNTHEPYKIKLDVEKVWVDENNRDNVRPDSITVKLNADKEVKQKGQTLVLDNEHEWKGSFVELPKNYQGEEVKYSLEEVKVNGYDITDISKIVDGKITITNTHNLITKDITVEKIWQDSNNQDGKRPEKITVILKADNVEVDRQELSGTDSNWTYKFEKLPVYKEGKVGQEIVYTVEEVITQELKDNYTTTVNGFKIYNSHENEQLEIKGTKTWDDANNQDGVRPESITVHLNADGEVIDTKTVTAEDNWSYNFGKHDKYKNGQPITYTITEDAVENYDTKIDNFNITNTHKPELITISGTKTWVDEDNRDGARPESITINLLADKVKVASKEVKVDDEGNWKFEFTELEKYAKGEVKREVVYTIEEVDVDGYSKEISGYDVTNTHEIETIKFNITKTWEDYEDNDGKRPESITIRLFADGKEIDSFEMTAENGWTYSSDTLPRYKKGEVKQEIIYTIKEDEIEGYDSIISDPEIITDDNQGKTINNSITNTHEKETIKIEGEKTWDDFENKYDSRPDEITIYLYKKDELYMTIVVSSENEWKYVIDNLDKYADGEEITYTIKEKEVEGYETTIEGYNISNKLIWNVGDGEVPPQTGYEISFNNVLYIIVSGLLFILGYSLKHKEN